MAKYGFFAHIGIEGDTPGTRLQWAGWLTNTTQYSHGWGENIAGAHIADQKKW
jgi:hypothetical protein